MTLNLRSILKTTRTPAEKAEISRLILEEAEQLETDLSENAQDLKSFYQLFYSLPERPPSYVRILRTLSIDLDDDLSWLVEKALQNWMRGGSSFCVLIPALVVDLNFDPKTLHSIFETFVSRGKRIDQDECIRIRAICRSLTAAGVHPDKAITYLQKVFDFASFVNLQLREKLQDELLFLSAVKAQLQATGLTSLSQAQLDRARDTYTTLNLFQKSLDGLIRTDSELASLMFSDDATSAVKRL